MRKINLIMVALTAAIVLLLDSFWFVFSDRRLAFLYGHLHATPYDASTISRYLTTGLIAGGVVLIFYVVFNWGVKLIKRQYQLPNWRRVWLGNIMILVPLMMIMLMAFGRPTLSFLMAVGVVLVTIFSLGLALLMGDYIVRNLKLAVFTFLDGLGWVPLLILLPLGVAFAGRKSQPQALLMIVLITIGGGLLWMALMTFWQKKIKRSFSAPKNIFWACLTVAYLIGPLLHYLISRPQHLYVSSADNFFSRNLLVEVLTLIIVVAMLGLIGWWRKNNNWRSLLKSALIVSLFLGLSYGCVYFTADKNPNIWACEHDQWVKKGEPAYDQPFPEECGIIDKIIMGV